MTEARTAEEQGFEAWWEDFCGKNASRLVKDHSGKLAARAAWNAALAQHRDVLAAAREALENLRDAAAADIDTGNAFHVDQDDVDGATAALAQIEVLEGEG